MLFFNDISNLEFNEIVKYLLFYCIQTSIVILAIHKVQGKTINSLNFILFLVSSLSLLFLTSILSFSATQIVITSIFAPYLIFRRVYELD